MRASVLSILPLPRSKTEQRALDRHSAPSVAALLPMATAAARQAAAARERATQASGAVARLEDSTPLPVADTGGAASVMGRLKRLLFLMRHQLPVELDVEAHSPKLCPEIWIAASADAVAAFGLRPAKASSAKAATPMRERTGHRRLLERSFMKSSDLDHIFGERWYVEFAGRLGIVYCPPIRVSVDEVWARSEREIYDRESGTYSPMEVFRDDRELRLSFRPRYVALLADMLGDEIFEEEVQRFSTGDD